LPQQRSAGFGQDAVACQPEIGQLRGHDNAVLIDISRQQLGIEAGLENGLGLGGVFVSNDVDQRQRGEGFCAGAPGLANPGVRIAQQGIQIHRVWRIGATRLPGATELVQIPDHEDGGRCAQQPENHAEKYQPRTFKVQGQRPQNHQGQIENKNQCSNQGAFHSPIS
jgi:hypothetical protein